MKRCLLIILFLLLGCAAPVSTPEPSPEPTPEDQDQDQDQDPDQNQNPDSDPDFDSDPESETESDQNPDPGPSFDSDPTFGQEQDADPDQDLSDEPPAPSDLPDGEPEPEPEPDLDQNPDPDSDPDQETSDEPSAPRDEPEPDPEPDCTITLDPDDWTIVYTGYGTVDLNDPDGFFLEPMAATGPSETHAALLLSDEIAGCTFQDFRLTVHATTEAQLRTPLPNPWEVFWIFFNYQTTTSGKETNYFILKTNGIELGQAYDSVGQNFLFTASAPTLSVGEEYEYVLEKIGAELTVAIDGVTVLSYGSDPTDDPLYDQAGQIGLYTEDARVRIHSVSLEEL